MPNSCAKGLALAEPAVAQRILTRVAAASQARLLPDFPGDPTTGLLFTQPQHEEAFADFANDELCPVLDPKPAPAISTHSAQSNAEPSGLPSAMKKTI
jgi:alpha-beta hydrolase superfamily lysophospholipase